MKRIIFIGPFPPPVHGQSLVTEKIYESLKNGNNTPKKIVKISTSPNGRFRILSRALMLPFSLVVFLISAPFSCSLYISLNANKGMIETLMYLLLFRLVRPNGKVLVHHHTYSHIRKKSLIFKAIASFGFVHVTQCSCMSLALKKKYDKEIVTKELCNAFLVDAPFPQIRNHSDDPGLLAIGFFGNITVDKGILDAVKVTESLVERGINAKLVVAGKCSEKDIENMLASNSAVEYLGPLYGKDKSSFYSSIDVFVFPTLYKNETQGIVCLEALSHGVPVVLYDTACTYLNVISDDDAVNLGEVEAMSSRVEFYYRKKIEGNISFERERSVSCFLEKRERSFHQLSRVFDFLN